MHIINAAYFVKFEAKILFSKFMVRFIPSICLNFHRKSDLVCLSNVMLINGMLILKRRVH